MSFEGDSGGLVYVGVCRSIIPIGLPITFCISATNISHLKTYIGHASARMRHSSDRHMAVATSGGGRAH